MEGSLEDEQRCLKRLSLFLWPRRGTNPAYGGHRKYNFQLPTLKKLHFGETQGDHVLIKMEVPRGNPSFGTGLTGVQLEAGGHLQEKVRAWKQCSPGKAGRNRGGVSGCSFAGLPVLILLVV